MEDTKNKSLFRWMWNLISDGEQDQSEDFDVFFQNYADAWFDDFMEFFSMSVENREHIQHPKHTFSDIEPKDEGTRTEWYMHEKVHPALHTIIWNLSWFHADFCKKLAKTEKSV